MIKPKGVRMRYLYLPLLLVFSTVQAAPQECLGRLSFTMPEQFQWATSKAAIPMANRASFSSAMYLDADQWDYNHIVSIMVTEPTESRTAFEGQWKAYMPSTIWLKEQKSTVESRIRTLDKVKNKYKEQQEMRAKGIAIPSAKVLTKEDIADVELSLKVAQEKLDEMENRKIPQVPLAIADAYTIDYANQRAFVRRDNRDYMFYFSNAGRKSLGIENRAVTVAEVNQQLTQFQPRQLGTVPLQTGFCFPYGFIDDDGKLPYEIKNSFRFTDQPNVAYSIYTGNSSFFSKGNILTHGIARTEPPGIQDPTKFTLERIDQTITLKNGATLNFKGWNASENKPADPKNPRHYYWLWGQLTSPQTAHNRPFVVFQIRAFDKDEKDGRPNYAPPLTTAIKRLQPILDTVQIY